MAHSRPRWIAPLATGIAGAALLAGLWAGQQLSTRPGDWANAPPEVRAVLWPEPREPGDFNLQTQHGERFGPEQLRGQWSFMFFGYLQCPDVCPTTLSALRDLRRTLLERDPEAGRYRFIFVSVDPEFDRPEGMGPYLDYFDPAFIGLSGPAEALQPLTSSLAVMHSEHVDDNGRRSIDHTSSVMVFDPDGHAVGALPPPHHPQSMLARFEALRRHLAR